jgi:capsid protein
MLFALLMLSSTFIAGTTGVSEAPPSTAQISASAGAYDAIDSKNKRKSPAVKNGAEDLLLNSSQRSKLTANARDIARNYAVAAWMIRKHLDYVSTFSFQMRSADDGLNQAIEDLWDDWSRPTACDVASRHTLDGLLRLGEARRTVDGDMGFLKLASGELQAIEGDRVRDPSGQGPYLPGEPKSGKKWIHGVLCDETGRALAYAVHKRTGVNSYEFERSITASRMAWFGYYERFDQVRGISPITTALNPLRDTYEALDYAIVKAKISQLFGIKFTRAATEAGGELSGGVDSDGNEDKSSYSVDFGRSGFALDMDPGDNAEFMESSTPSTQFQEFVKTSINIALKALDIPYSFWDESYTNFFGSRAAWLHYRTSCKSKWRDAIELRRKIALWRLSLWIVDGTIPIKKSQTIRDLAFEFIPAGFPWWDPSKEINGAVQEIKAGFNTPQQICRERGTDYYDNLRQIRKAMDAAEEEKVPIEWAFAPVAAVELPEASNGA